jgi:hypothetical protein
MFGVGGAVWPGWGPLTWCWGELVQRVVVAAGSVGAWAFGVWGALPRASISG